MVSSSDIWRKGVISSKIQKLRPCVPTTISSSFITKSLILVAGIFSLNDCQFSPSSKDTYTAFSEPANNNPLREGSSRTVLIGSLGKPLTISFQFFPPSFVRKICGRWSSSLIRLTATKATFLSKCPASICEIFDQIQKSFCSPFGVGGVTFCQVFPPSFVI